MHPAAFIMSEQPPDQSSITQIQLKISCEATTLLCQPFAERKFKQVIKTRCVCFVCPVHVIIKLLSKARVHLYT